MPPSERQHGGLPLAELHALGIAPESVVDLSANINPYGPSETVTAALRNSRFHDYPDPGCRAARRALAASLGVDPETVILGNGASELLWTLTFVLAPTPSSIVIAEPTFAEARAAAEAFGHAVVPVRGTPHDGYAVNLCELARAIQRTDAALVYLCNPTTPIGLAMPAADLEAFARRVPGTFVLLDESFLSLSDQHGDLAVTLPENVIRLRSLTKDHALAGVRLGYALCPADVVRRAERARPSWTVSALAQAAVPVAIAEASFVARSRARLQDDRRALVHGLGELGIAPWPSSAPYLAFDVRDAARLRQRLLARHRVLVRDCSSFGLPQTIRVAVRPAAERERLLQALHEETALW